MPGIRIDADAMVRAVTAHDYKLLAHYLDLRSGEITSRTLTPEEVQEPPPGPSVPPLPVLGGDLSVKKDASPFGPPPGEAAKKDLFKDEGPKKEAFAGDFWKRDKKESQDPFGGGFQRTSGTKKLAELFGEKPPDAEAKRIRDPFAKPDEESKAANAAKAEQKPEAPDSGGEFVARIDEDSPLQRIPPANEAQHVLWMRTFAKECGDPQIGEKLLHALGAKKPIGAFEKALRGYQRMHQQWLKYYRRQALHYAEAWLKALPVEWAIVEDSAPGPG